MQLNSAGSRLLIIGFIAIVLIIPLMMVSGLVDDRSQIRQQARQSIANGWAGEQVVGGLIKETFRTTNRDGSSHVRSTVHMAQSLRIDARLELEQRHIGIHEFPVYIAHMNMTGSLAVSRPAGSNLLLPIADIRGVRSVTLRVGGRELAAEGGTLSVREEIQALAFKVDADLAENAPFEIELVLAGMGAISFLPMARQTDVTLQMPWGDPGFNGSFLPTQRSVTDETTEATWQVLGINRSWGQHVSLDGTDNWRESMFGVRLYTPVDLYQRAERATKYGFLFVALTFLTLFVLDILRGSRLHPIQFVFVGLSLTVFFLVLLALAEHIGFGWAYMVAAMLLIVINASYSAAIFRDRAGGVMVGALLTSLYILVYWLLISEQYSLLVGALSLLAVLSLAMFATRHVDWGRAAVAKPGAGTMDASST